MAVEARCGSAVVGRAVYNLGAWRVRWFLPGASSRVRRCRYLKNVIDWMGNVQDHRGRGVTSIGVIYSRSMMRTKYRIVWSRKRQAAQVVIDAGRRIISVAADVTKARWEAAKDAILARAAAALSQP
jgi:hypothetical protein